LAVALDANLQVFSSRNRRTISPITGTALPWRAGLSIPTDIDVYSLYKRSWIENPNHPNFRQKEVGKNRDLSSRSNHPDRDYHRRKRRTDHCAS
jgi:hypothetical protein